MLYVSYVEMSVDPNVRGCLDLRLEALFMAWTAEGISRAHRSITSIHLQTFCWSEADEKSHLISPLAYSQPGSSSIAQALLQRQSVSL